jgi:hypothetical protein
MTIKHLPATLFNELADYKFDRRFAVLPPGVTFEDLFVPTLWAHYANKWHKHDIVRVVAEDGLFDVDLTVAEVTVGAISMKVRPFYGNASAEAAVSAATKVAESGRLSVVPLAKDGLPVVRVEHRAATKWRVLGLNGEISRDHETEAAATKAMTDYLKATGLTMPVPESTEPAEVKPKPKGKAA